MVMTAKQMKITLKKSIYGQLANVAQSVRGLGLRKPHQTVVVVDTPENRGLIRTARHLLAVVES
ncbi:MAG: 50S ribosomal protein L30 [Gammaproteobacteria bacterium]|nr:50S ribosomal protein L30 [Gammaproteobacteria bacterium]